MIDSSDRYSIKNYLLPWRVTTCAVVIPSCTGFLVLVYFSALEMSQRAFVLFWLGAAFASLPSFMIGLIWHCAKKERRDLLSQKKKLFQNLALALAITVVAILILTSGLFSHIIDG